MTVSQQKWRRKRAEDIDRRGDEQGKRDWILIYVGFSQNRTKFR